MTKNCPVCGKKVGLFTSSGVRIEDGPFCIDCWTKLSKSGVNMLNLKVHSMTELRILTGNATPEELAAYEEACK